MARRPDPYHGRQPTKAEALKRLHEMLAIGYRRGLIEQAKRQQARQGGRTA